MRNFLNMSLPAQEKGGEPDRQRQQKDGGEPAYRRQQTTKGEPDYQRQQGSIETILSEVKV